MLSAGNAGVSPKLLPALMSDEMRLGLSLMVKLLLWDLIVWMIGAA